MITYIYNEVTKTWKIVIFKQYNDHSQHIIIIGVYNVLKYDYY